MLLEMINSTGSDYAHFRRIEGVVEDIIFFSPESL